MFDFDADPGFTCDAWVSNEETNTAGSRSVVEKHASEKVAGLPRYLKNMHKQRGWDSGTPVFDAARSAAKTDQDAYMAALLGKHVRGRQAAESMATSKFQHELYGLPESGGSWWEARTISLGRANKQAAKDLLRRVEKARGKTKKAGVPFLEQDRPEKVKEIYRALKRDHPNMPPEMKARIAAKQGKPGKQRQGPPYKGPIRSEYTTAMRKRDKTMQKRSELEKTAILNWLKGLFKKKRPDPMEVLQAAKKKARYGGADLYGKVGGPAAPAVQLERLKAARNIQKTARVLTAKGRRQIRDENFALPGRRYPIHDRSHARNALSRVAEHGTPAEKAIVRAAVARRYPGIGQEKKAMSKKDRKLREIQDNAAAGAVVGGILAMQPGAMLGAYAATEPGKRLKSMAGAGLGGVVGGAAGAGLGTLAGGRGGSVLGAYLGHMIGAGYGAGRVHGKWKEKKAMPRFPRIPMPELPTISRGSRRALAAAGVGTAAGGAGGFVGGEAHGKREMRGSMFTPQEVQYAYAKGQQDVIRAIRARQGMGKQAASKMALLGGALVPVTAAVGVAETLRLKKEGKNPYGLAGKVMGKTAMLGQPSAKMKALLGAAKKAKRGVPSLPYKKRPSVPGVPGLPAGRKFPGTAGLPKGKFPGATPPMFPGKMKLSHVDPSSLFIPKSILGF